MDNYKIVDCEQFGTQDIESLLNISVEKYPEYELHSLQSIIVREGDIRLYAPTDKNIAIFKLKET